MQSVMVTGERVTSGSFPGGARAPQGTVSARWRLLSGWVAALLVAACFAVPGCAPGANTSGRPPEPGASRSVPGAAGRVAAPAPAAALPGALAEGRHGAVSSPEAHATDIGIEVLRRGGNAVDAAVAVGFALGVTHPSAGNIGGGGFMIVRLPDGTSSALDYREVAPGRASADMFLDAAGAVRKDSELGPRAAGIPGTVAGLAFAHRKFGSLPWAELLGPAVALAQNGLPLDAIHAEELRDVCAEIRAYRDRVPQNDPALRAALTATLSTFARPDGQSYAPGDVWRQPELAHTLELLRDEGPEEFYRGRLAREMASTMETLGGLWKPEDLAGYRVIERQPVVFSYRGHQIISMPPPSSGGIALREILTASEALGLHRLDWDSPQRIHLYVEILRRSFADRNGLISDPDFNPLPVQKLLDERYVRARMADIDPERATPSARVAAGAAPGEPDHTTHFSVVDATGIAVANTYTLNGDFGARVQIPGTGVTLNNEMDDFTAKVGAPNQFGLIQGKQNAIAPGKRMLSSMSPTIITKGGVLRAVVGSPGGPTIITTVAQIVLQLIDTPRSLEHAVGAVRIHHQWLPDEITHEPALPVETRHALESMGHRLVTEESIGHANCIEVDPVSGSLRAVADVARFGGKAAAY
jgi:gamma-glutamyltranspeptidase / glutathione hydrolase